LLRGVIGEEISLLLPLHSDPASTFNLKGTAQGSGRRPACSGTMARQAGRKVKTTLINLMIRRWTLNPNSNFMRVLPRNIQSQDRPIHGGIVPEFISTASG